MWVYFTVNVWALSSNPPSFADEINKAFLLIWSLEIYIPQSSSILVSTSIGQIYANVRDAAFTNHTARSAADSRNSDGTITITSITTGNVTAFSLLRQKQKMPFYYFLCLLIPAHHLS